MTTLQLASNCKIKITEEEEEDVLIVEIFHNKDSHRLTSIGVERLEDLLTIQSGKRFYLKMYNGGYFISLSGDNLTIEFQVEEYSFSSVLKLE